MKRLLMMGILAAMALAGCGGGGSDKPKDLYEVVCKDGTTLTVTDPGGVCDAHGGTSNTVLLTP